MNEMIAFCGLDCEQCEARLATVNDDDLMRERVAASWSKLNGVSIGPEDINCTGCRVEGVKTVFCNSLCQIRKCASEKHLECCGNCSRMLECEKLSMITGNNEDAKKRLLNFRR